MEEGRKKKKIIKSKNSYLANIFFYLYNYHNILNLNILINLIS